MFTESVIVERSMGKTKDLSAFDRGQIVGARRMGHSISEVVQALGFSRATVSRVYREYVDSGKTIPARANCRGQQRVDDRGRRRLARMVTADRRATVQQITRQFNAAQQQRVSSHTIHNHLLAMGYRSHRPTRVPLLTTRHRAQRLAWAREHRHGTLETWKKVAWTDESRFTLVHADGRVRVRRKPHEAMDPSCQQGTLQAGGGGILVWGLFTWTEMGPLVQVTSSLTGGRYRDILDDHVVPFVRLQHPTGDLCLQQDNAPCHRSRIVSEWLDEHSTDMKMLPWPSRSPDLNPIEHIWDAIERDVRAFDPPPANLRELWETVQRSWISMASQRFQCLVESMPRRIAAVIKAKGGATRY